MADPREPADASGAGDVSALTSRVAAARLLATPEARSCAPESAPATEPQCSVAAPSAARSDDGDAGSSGAVRRESGADPGVAAATRVEINIKFDAVNRNGSSADASRRRRGRDA